MTDADRAALEVIRGFGGKPFTCTMLGETLFHGTRTRQAYARPAGKVLHRLKRLALVREDYDWVSDISRMVADPASKRACWRESR